MTALLYRYMISKTSSAAVPLPPQQATGWPTYLNYTGSFLTQNCTGADVNPFGAFACTHQNWQSSIVNSARKSKVTTVFFYPIDALGNIGPIEMISSVNYGQAASFAAYGNGLGVNPTAKTIALCQRFGTETFNNFTNTYQSTYSTVTGGFWWHNGSTWVGVAGGAGATWVQRPVWNALGTFVAAANTASTGPGVNIVMNLTGWTNATGTVTSSTNVTIPNSSYAKDYWWIGDDLFINGNGLSGPTIFVYRRVGTNLTPLNSFPYTAMSGYTNINLSNSTPDVTNSRFFSPVVTANNGVSSTTVLAGFEMDYDSGTGNITPTPITGASHASGSFNDIKWAIFPLGGDNRMVLNPVPFNGANAPELYRTTPAIVQQGFQYSTWFEFISGAAVFKAHLPSGAAVFVGNRASNETVMVQKLS